MDESKSICIYCEKPKNLSEFSLEHAIPEFICGRISERLFQTKNVCRVCNNNLGLFVDGAVARQFVVSRTMAQMAYVFYDPDNVSALPLVCFGAVALNIPSIGADEVCEYYQGPLKENVYWVRKRDDELYWYNGGNPITAKKKETRAYFFFNEYTERSPKVTVESFRNAFEGYKVKKILGTETSFDPALIGFVKPDELDESRVLFFAEIAGRQRATGSINLAYDHRFMSKLALGVGYCVLGKEFLTTRYSKILRNGIWPKNLSHPPQVRGATDLQQGDAAFKKWMGFKSAVAVTLKTGGSGLSLNLNIGESLNWSVLVAPLEDLSGEIRDKYSEGITFLFFKQLTQLVQLGLPELLAHKLGSFVNLKLLEIERLLQLREMHPRSLKMIMQSNPETSPESTDSPPS